jgi:hypothetical protein
METTYTSNPKLEAKLRDARKIVSNMGTLFGKTICYLAVDNVDLEHISKEKNDTHPRLVKPLKKFMVNTITITKLELIPVDDSIYVQFNDDINLRAKIVQDPKFFANPGAAEIEEAIDRALNGNTPLFFTNREKLTQEANFRNQQEAAKAEELANSFIAQQSLLRDLIMAQETDCQEYLRQLGLSK